MKKRRLKFQDLMIVAPDARPDVTSWLRGSACELAELCNGRGANFRLVTHTAVGEIKELEGDHCRLFAHAFGMDPSSTGVTEPDIVRDYLEGNRSFRSELNALDQLLAELREPLLILRDVSHFHVAAIADWLQSAPGLRMVNVVLLVDLPSASSGLARNGSIQMVRQNLRLIREIINVTVFVAVPEEEALSADVGLVHDASIHSIAPADLSQAARDGELGLRILRCELLKA